MAWAGIKYDVKTSLRTSLDGMILQAYFTGALSFLPLASDVELKGETENKAKCSAMALLMLLGISLTLDTLGVLLGMVLLEVWAAQMLLYTFVISFPLKPLEGSDVFAASRLQWFGIFLLVLLAFLLNMPETFYAIL
jgi:putative Mn2+ efflux pump MntP